jgi:arylsulfatase
MQMEIIRFLTIILCFSILIPNKTSGRDKKHPNVIIIITDDQGYGDLGITGNPHVNTPVIDQFAKESVRFNNFYVSPVCAPTRSSLMTGRYSLRTGIRDTYNGGSIMASNEVTIAEMLQSANYKTGIFGKWHLGDNYPCRPSDQGFDESLIHLSGGIGQVGDVTNYFKGNTSYFDPVLWHNNQQEAFQGYCSDIFTREAMRFIEQNKEGPFFCYLSYNAPHTPLQVPDEYYHKYKDVDPSSGLENDGRPFPDMTEKDKEAARKVYAMVDNIDDNLGKLFDKLDDLKIADNTLIIFMTDNGPQQYRYIAGMRGKKSKVYQGGVRVPFYLKYPSMDRKGKDIDAMAAHIDILPTLAEVCNVELPKNKTIDGVNLMSVINNEKQVEKERSMFFYWSRRYPELYHNMALLRGDYKLVGHAAYNASINDFELFDLANDPYEQNNIVLKKKDLAQQMKAELDELYHELIKSENLINQPRIIVGNNHENPIILNRNDAGGERGIWAQEEVYGKWRVSIEEGYYNIKFKFIKPLKANGKMYLETNQMVNQMVNNQVDSDIIEMKNVYLPQMDCDVIPFYSIGSKRIFPFWVEMHRIEKVKDIN